ncbi:hypothetical protein LguiB_013391 [Lonicera macranthoides]
MNSRKSGSLTPWKINAIKHYKSGNLGGKAIFSMKNMAYQTHPKSSLFKAYFIKSLIENYL